MGDRILSQHHEVMARGQGEALMPFLEARLKEAGLGWEDLDAIAVGVGPGNFTGIRIAVSAARGLALGLGRPALGVSTFACLKAELDGLGAEPAELRVLPAPRDQAYGQLFRYGWPEDAPIHFDPDAPPQDLARPNLTVLGHRAEEIAAAFGAPARTTAVAAADLPARLLQNAAWLLQQGREVTGPAPLYVKPADAAPPRDAPPVLID